MGANVVELTTANFDSEVLQSTQPVLVDFWAPWCAPCRQIAPMIEELATENVGTAKVGKLNIDEAQGLAEKYGVSSIPTLLIFKGGAEGVRFVGAKPKAKLQEALNDA